MRHEFNIIIERDEKYYFGYCPEIPGANGQGETIGACKDNVREAIALILEDRLCARGSISEFRNGIANVDVEDNSLD